MAEIKAKQVGKNLIVVIDGQKFVKVINDKAEGDSIKNKITLYNKNESDMVKNQLLDIFDTVSKEKAVAKGKKKAVKKVVKEKVKAVKKASKRTEKNAAKKTELIKALKNQPLSREDINELKGLIKKNEEVVQEQPKAVEGVKRRGEY